MLDALSGTEVREGREGRWEGGGSDGKAEEKEVGVTERPRKRRRKEERKKIISQLRYYSGTSLTRTRLKRNTCLIQTTFKSLGIKNGY